MRQRIHRRDVEDAEKTLDRPYPVREGEELNVPALEAYLRAHLGQQ